MFFGQRSFESPKRGVPTSVKRQIAFQVILLVVVVGLGLVAATQLGRKSDAPVEGTAPGQTAELDLLAKQLEAELESEIGEVADRRPPAPFEENQELIDGIKERDRTGEPDDGKMVLEEGIEYFFWQIRSAEEAFLGEEPVLSTRRGDRILEKINENPDDFRGKVIEVRGNLFSASRGEKPLRLKGLRPDSSSGLDRAFRSYVYDKNEPTFFLVYTYDDTRDYSHLDDVTLRACFCRLYKGDVVVGGRAAEGVIPLLVGKSYRFLKRPAMPTMDIRMFIPVVIVLTVVVAVVIGIVSYRSQRDYQKRRAEARKELKERGEK